MTGLGSFGVDEDAQDDMLDVLKMPIRETIGSVRAHDVIIARGHENIKAKNPRTVEITKDPYVTRWGDCIIACCADKGASEMSSDVLRLLEEPGNLVVAILQAGGRVEIIRGRSPGRRPDCAQRIIFRRSNYADGSTVMVGADKAAVDLDRNFVEFLRNYPVVKLTILVAEL